MKNVAVQILPWESESPTRSLDLTPQNDDTLVQHPSKKVITLVAVLIGLQVLDGALTLAGMHTFGLGAEGNPLLRGLMNSIGLIPGLLVTKLLCIGVIMGLYSQMTKVRWLPTALTAVAGVYTCCAIIPWSILLISQ
jgi:hypothetical protein